VIHVHVHVDVDVDVEIDERTYRSRDGDLAPKYKAGQLRRRGRSKSWRRRRYW
jgi:hypothetical protein